MILSAPPKRQWTMPAVQWVTGWQSNLIGQWDSSGMMDGTMSSELDKTTFGILDLCFFC
jgi:hypothetical protein